MKVNSLDQINMQIEERNSCERQFMDQLWEQASTVNPRLLKTDWLLSVYFPIYEPQFREYWSGNKHKPLYGQNRGAN